MFTPKIGEDSHFDYIHIMFHMGWHHQLAYLNSTLVYSSTTRQGGPRHEVVSGEKKSGPYK